MVALALLFETKPSCGACWCCSRVLLPEDQVLTHLFVDTHTDVVKKRFRERFFACCCSCVLLPEDQVLEWQRPFCLNKRPLNYTYVLQEVDGES